VGNQQLSIHIKTLLDDLKSSKNYCPRKLFSGSNSSPEKSLQKNRSIFGLKNRSCDRSYSPCVEDETMRLGMIVEMQIEILNGGEILVNCTNKITI